LALINTCAFIREAAKEALEAIFEVRAQLPPGAKLIVCGCLPARYGRELNLEEADLIVPRSRYGELPSLLEGLFGKGGARPPAARGGEGGEGGEGFEGGEGVKGGEGAKDADDDGVAAQGPAAPGSQAAAAAPYSAPFESWGRAVSTPPWRAWLKISEGCARKCTYCVIPQIRGPLAPEPKERLFREASRLAEGGALELTLTAQDLTAWTEGEEGLLSLLERLSGVPGIKWLRLMYVHPESLTKGLLEGLRSLPKVAPYLDVPFQHASKKILKAMGRGRTRPYETIELIRRHYPEAALRTTLMAGFPGEGEEDFQELTRFLEFARFDCAGFFKFSPEEGAPAASLSGRVPQILKEKRVRRLRALQRKISESLGKQRVGSVVDVLTEGPSPDSDLVACGRGPFQAPDSDGLIFFEGPQPPGGLMVRARVKRARGFDLTAVWEGGERRA
jgi:MiaB/RimO family radical SAM methylthiotransferase